MKKLIALLSSVAIVASFSFSAMAATSSTTYNALTDTFVTTVTADVGDQATLLAFPGTELGTDPAASISFIDQQTTTAGATEFTYKMKTTPAAGQLYTIKVGGSLLATPLSETITPIAAATGYTVSGTVNNAIFTAFTVDDFADLEDLPGQQAKVDSFTLANTTNIRLIPFADLHLFVKYIKLINTSDTSTTVKSGTVDSTSGSFELSGVANGSYALIIQRDGYVPRMIKVDVDGANFVLPSDKSLIAGDIFKSLDFYVDFNDILEILYNQYFFDSPSYDQHLNLNADNAVDYSDVMAAFANNGFSYATYAEDGSIDIDVLAE